MSTMTMSWYSSAASFTTSASPTAINGSKSTAPMGAARFLREHGVQEARVTTAWQAIALHTSIGLAHKFGAEQAITQMGIAEDIVGADSHLLPSGADRVHASWPRHDLGYALTELIADQVEANPGTTFDDLSPPSASADVSNETRWTWFRVLGAAGGMTNPVRAAVPSRE